MPKVNICTEQGQCVINWVWYWDFLSSLMFKIVKRWLKGNHASPSDSAPRPLCLSCNYFSNLKGQCHEIFDFRFSWISFTKHLSITLGIFQFFFENSWKYSQLKVHHRCRWHWWQMLKIFNLKSFNYFVWTPFGSKVNILINFFLQLHFNWHCSHYLSPVSTTPAVPVGKFTAGVIDTGGAPWFANFSTSFRKNLKSSLCYFQWLWGRWFIKKPEAKNIVTVSLSILFWKYRKMALVRNTRNPYNRDVNEVYWMTHTYKLDLMSCANIYSSTNLQYLQYIHIPTCINWEKRHIHTFSTGYTRTCSSCESYGGDQRIHKSTKPGMLSRALYLEHLSCDQLWPSSSTLFVTKYLLFSSRMRSAGPSHDSGWQTDSHTYSLSPTCLTLADRRTRILYIDTAGPAHDSGWQTDSDTYSWSPTCLTLADRRTHIHTAGPAHDSGWQTDSHT